MESIDKTVSGFEVTKGNYPFLIYGISEDEFNYIKKLYDLYPGEAEEINFKIKYNPQRKTIGFFYSSSLDKEQKEQLILDFGEEKNITKRAETLRNLVLIALDKKRIKEEEWED